MSPTVLRSERNQGRAIDMGWLDHDRLGFNYRLTEVQAALGIAQVERADELLSRPRRRRRALRRGARRARRQAGRRARCRPGWPAAALRGPWRRAAQLVRLHGPAAEGLDREAVIADLDQRGIDSKAYLPCIHLMPHYRERFGFKGGEFPVAERLAERSLALPFFPSMSEDQVARVAEDLAEALGTHDWSVVPAARI